jgi:hypothetical protein
VAKPEQKGSHRRDAEIAEKFVTRVNEGVPREKVTTEGAEDSSENAENMGVGTKNGRWGCASARVSNCRLMLPAEISGRLS